MVNACFLLQYECPQGFYISDSLSLTLSEDADELAVNVL